MIFVLGILSLLALIGLVLITRTHGEFKRVAEQSASSSSAAVRNGVVRKIREVLRLDIWGAAEQVGLPDSGRPLTNITPPNSTKNPFGLLENNEPWDAPGESDRWLASLTPYFVGQVEVFNDPTATPMQVSEDEVLAWRYVSYLGSDVTSPVGPFMWGLNSRLPSTPALLRYDASNLSNVRIIQTPTPLFVGPVIPGSTTNATIRAARAFWNSGAHIAALSDQLAGTGLLASLVPQFPYFDTNVDGEVDLYDADGDGVPDSPISFIVQTDSPDPNRPRQLYAVIRIVDHAAMTNVNTASALTLQGGSAPPNPDGLTFDETRSGFQRRGRRATEFLLDDVVHLDDWFLGNNRTANLTGYRNNSTPNPITFDEDVVRRTLLGGLPISSNPYRLYGVDDEASLRHRGMLVPYDRRNSRTSPAGSEYWTIDRALPGSLLWSRQVNAGASYTGDPRWSRLNANFNTNPASPYEGFTNGSNIGWRNLLDQDEPFAVRRPLLTTVNVEVMPPPDITTASVDTTRVVVAGEPTDTILDLRLRELWALGMNWPVLIPQGSPLLSDLNVPAGATLTDIFSSVPPDGVPAEWARVQPIDLNMGMVSGVTDVEDVTRDFRRYTAAAMYLALDGVDRYQGMPLTQAAGGADALLNREYLAWQFAANLADYRDSDNVPTMIEWPAGSDHYIFGVEKQPFFTEAYAALTAGADSPDADDKWFFAFELYVPPGWSIPTGNLYFRAPPDTTLTPLNNFQQVNSGASIGSLAGMDGGPADVVMVALGDDHGKYFVFTSNLPNVFDAGWTRTQDPDFQARAYKNNSPNLPLNIPTDGSGRLELVYSPSGTPGDAQNHLLDVIGPSYSGGDLADGTLLGEDRWAKRPPGMSEGGQVQFSLRRSTKGWRFTTCWHVYTEQPVVGGPGPSGGPEFDVSLGRPNAVLDDLNDNIPESIWPAITSIGGGPVPGFASGLPFQAFDSVADLGRMFLIGPVNLSQPVSLPNGQSRSLPALRLRRGEPWEEKQSLDLPATAMIAATLDFGPTGDLPPLNIDRVAAGRVDFMSLGRPSPWAWRLFDYLTTQSHLFDGIDNDGDGDVDLNDPTEAVDVLFRTAGRVNLNTAPVSVLRSGPFMSLLPTSPELNFSNSGASISNPVEDFNNRSGFFYDFPSAIVAIREDRAVPLRLLNTTTGFLEQVAIAELGGIGGDPAATARGAFAQVIELAELAADRRRLKVSFTGRNDIFQVDRFWSDGNLALFPHKIQAGDPDLGIVDPADDGNWFSPDFRYRSESDTADYVPIQQVVGSAIPLDAVEGDPFEAGGIRGRDVFLSRWTNVFSTRSDCFTAYIALLDEDGNIVQRSQVTLDRSVCFREIPRTPGRRGLPILPRILVRSDGSYADDTK